MFTRSSRPWRLALHPFTVCLLVAAWYAVWLGTPGRSEEAAESFGWYIPGFVVDERGEPVAGAVVETLQRDGKQTRTTANAKGKFLLKFRTSGPYGPPLRVRSPDGKRESLLTWLNYGNRKLFRVELKPVQTIDVLVADGQGKPVGDARVIVIAAQHPIADVRSDADGKVRLQVAQDAQLDWVLAYHDKHGMDYFENYDAFPSSERGTPPGKLTLHLDGGRAVKVKVLDTAKKPVRDVTIMPWTIKRKGKLSYVNLSGVMKLGKTDEHGVANFRWIPQDVEQGVTFLVHHPKFYCPQPPTFREAKDLSLTAEVLGMSEVSGKVTLPDGSPAANIRIQGEGRGDSNHYFRGHTMTRKDGTYTLPIYPDQLTMIAITDDNFAAASHTDIRLREHQKRDKVDFQLGPGTIIRGTVTVGPDKLPADGQNATLIQKNEEGGSVSLVRWSETNEQGRYEFRVGPGIYELRLPNQPWDKFKRVEVAAQPELTFDSHAARRDRGTLAGVMRDADQQPLADCKIYGESVASAGHAGFQTTSGADGQFRTERWNDLMIVYARHSARNLAGFKMISDGDQRVELELLPAAELKGRVVDMQGKPLAQQRVQLMIQPDVKAGRGINIFARTDDKGMYHFRGVSPGGQCRVYAGTQSLEVELKAPEPHQVEDLKIQAAAD